MTANGDKVASAIQSLVTRLTQEQASGRTLSPKEALVLRLNEQYPNDVGVLSAFFLNLVGNRAKPAHDTANLNNLVSATLHSNPPSDVTCCFPRVHNMC